MVDFRALGQPTDRRLRTLPTWALEWIETLKYRVMFWAARANGTEPGRSRINAAEPTALEILKLPFWAQDWIDDLTAEIRELKDNAIGRYPGKRGWQ